MHFQRVSVRVRVRVKSKEKTFKENNRVKEHDTLSLQGDMCAHISAYLCVFCAYFSVKYYQNDRLRTKILGCSKEIVPQNTKHFLKNKKVHT